MRSSACVRPDTCKAVKPDLKIVFAGHVDHGKSTLVGRLLHETGNISPAKVEELAGAARRRGVPFEWSFVVDALQAERDQAVTIDATRAWFSWAGRRYAIIDAPGHREFLRNMVSGAAEADAAILVVDAVEGVGEQTRRHARVLSLLGIRETVVAVNKMDAVGWDASRFEQVREECRTLLGTCQLRARGFVPISAREADNLIAASDRMPWYRGAPLIELLADLEPAAAPADTPARMRVQDVYREGEIRIAVGRLDGGTIAAGDTIVVLPSGSRATVRSIERWNSPERKIAIAGESIGLTFREPVYIARGDVISREAQPPALGYGFRTVCFWLAETPPVIGEHLTLQMGPTSVRVAPEGFEGVLDSGSLEICSTEEIPRYAVIELRLRAGALLAADEYATLPGAARFVLLRGHDIAAGGFITEVLGSREAHVQPEAHLVAPEERSRRNGHRGAVIWLTGLSASGKSTLATALERRLFSAGAAVYTLDGDNLRVGLNNDLGFSGADRAENIRRVGEVAALFADAGMIVITAFISPMARDRALARRAAGDHFHEVYVRADLATCERRDPKGLYKKARAGEIAEFTGISAPYEPPIEAEFIIDTQDFALDRCVQDLFDYVAAAANLGAWIATRSI